MLSNLRQRELAAVIMENGVLLQSNAAKIQPCCACADRIMALRLPLGILFLRKRLEGIVMARFNSLLGRNKFPVPVRRELGSKIL